MSVTDGRTDGHDGYQRAYRVHMASRGKSFRRISLKFIRGRAVWLAASEIQIIMRIQEF